MLTKRIIPCLDIRDGRTVKGINFENIRDAGIQCKTQLAEHHNAQGDKQIPRIFIIRYPRPHKQQKQSCRGDMD